MTPPRSLNAVPGRSMLRIAMPFLDGMKHASPISQSAASAVLFS